MAKAWVEDLWFDDERKPLKRHGHGSRWRVRWREDLTAKSRSRTFARKADAEEFATKLDNDVREGVYRAPERAEVLFADVADEWLRAHVSIKEATARRYERELRMYVLPRFGAEQVGRITKASIASWVADLATGRAVARYCKKGSDPVEYHDVAKMRRPLAARSIEHLHAVVSAVMGWAVETDRISRNPATGVRLPRPADADRVYLNPVEVEALAQAAKAVYGNAADRVLVLVLAYTGLRINEALALKVSAVNLRERTLRVVSTWTEDRDGNRVLGSPKTYERRTVPMPPFLADELRFLIAGAGREDWVFQAKRGGYVHDHNWRARVWNKAVPAAGLDGLGLTPHGLRHTAASAAIAVRADVKVVQRMLGHASAAMTLDVYADLWESRLGEVADALEAARLEALSGGSAGARVYGMRTAAS
jgi:integrase